MKTIQLKSISIRNFKGIKDFSTTPNGDDIEVFGDNDAGKTSIYDAFLWGLFHKDSKDRSQFKWKPLDSNNEEIHGLQTSVTVELLIDGKGKKFHKEMNETKGTRRKTKEVFYEDKPKYYIDDLEISTRTLYDELVSEIMEQELFKNLTSVTYFCEQLSPEDRRERLFNYFGSMSDDEIIETTESLHPLKAILNGEDVETGRLRVAQRTKQVNAALKEIPVKISTVQEMLVDVEGMDLEEATVGKATVTAEIDDLKDQKYKAENGELITDISRKIKDAETDVAAERVKYDKKLAEKESDLQKSLSELVQQRTTAEHNLYVTKNERDDVTKTITYFEKELENNKQLAASLREKYKEEKAMIYSHPPFKSETFDEHQTVCPTCQRAYDQSSIEEMRLLFDEEQGKKLEKYNQDKANAIKDFDEAKAATLKKINEEGKEAVLSSEQNSSTLADNRNWLEEKDEEIERLTGVVNKLVEEINKVEGSIKDIRAKNVPFENTVAFKSYEAKFDSLQKKAVDLKENVAGEIEKIGAQMAEKEQELSKYVEIISLFSERKRQEDKIEEYNEQERELSEEKGELTEKQVLFEQFYITKRDMLQDKINSHFGLVKWKLFDFYEEGGLNESVCEPMINGVPFSNLSNSGRIRAGMDVSNTLMKQEGIMVPIFIDNAEGATHRQDVDTQVIALNVSARNKKLKVTVKPKEMEGVA